MTQKPTGWNPDSRIDTANLLCADRMAIGRCSNPECMLPHIIFFDAAGKPFAAARWPQDDGRHLQLLQDMLYAASAVRE